MDDTGDSDAEQLTRAIVRQLRRAGLPVQDDEVRHGASISMATDDPADGFFVIWTCGSELIEEVAADTIAQQGPTAAMQENFDLNNIMREAILRILLTGGFDAEMSESDMELMDVLVRPRKANST